MSFISHAAAALVGFVFGGHRRPRVLIVAPIEPEAEAVEPEATAAPKRGLENAADIRAWWDRTQFSRRR